MHVFEHSSVLISLPEVVAVERQDHGLPIVVTLRVGNSARQVLVPDEAWETLAQAWLTYRRASSGDAKHIPEGSVRGG